jgi:hypothetical protein
VRCLLVWLFLIGFSLAIARADTIVVVVYDKNGLAVAADSWGKNEQTGSVSDHACKILPLGESMFFAAATHDLPAPEGSGSTVQGATWIYTEAQVAFNQLRLKSGEDSDGVSVEAVAQHWKQAIQEVLEETFATQPESFVQMPRDGYLLRGVFGGVDPTGGISLVVVSVKPKKAPAFEVMLEHLTPGSKLDYLALGRSEVVREFLERQTERARNEASQQQSELAQLDAGTQMARRAARLVDLTIGMQPPELPTVAGPIDILQLRPDSKLNWVQQKESCSAHE